MRPTARALLLAALVLLPMLPAAEAVGPEMRPWGSYNAGSEVNRIALAREGTTIAAALRAPTTASPSPTNPTAGCTYSVLPGQPGTACAMTDLAVLDHEYGFAQNLTAYGAPPTTAPGRTHVAVSRDGLAIASVGVEYAPGTNEKRLRLHYARIDATGNWSTPGALNRSVDLAPAEPPNGQPPTIVSLALSDDGRRVAVLYGEPGRYVLRGWAFTGGSLSSAFQLSAPGTPRALAASGDLSRMIVAGQFPEGNFTYGGAHVLPFAQATPLATWFDRAENNTDVRRAASSRDGQVVALADASGKVSVFRDPALASPTVANVSAAAVNITLSENGARLAAFTGASLVVLNTTSGVTPAWNVTAPGQTISAVAMSANGELVVVGSSGTGGAVVGYGDGDTRPLWQLPGDTRDVAVDAAGERIAYAQRAVVAAAKIPRTILMELAGGGKLSPQRVVTSPGNASFEVTLRNDGGGAERVVFEENAQGVSIQQSAPVLLRPGDILRTNVTVLVEGGLVGPRVFNVTARSLTSTALDNVTISIAPAPTLDVKLFVNETDILAQPNTTSEILLTIVNNGTGDSAVAIRAMQTVSAGSLWNLTLSESSLTALRGTRTSVKVSMTPPPNVENGTSAAVEFTLEGAGIYDTARVVYRINPTLAVEVNATGVTRFIEPGARAHYNVTVTNTGSLPRQFELFYTILDSSGRNWGVDMQSQTARLEPLQRRVIPVTIVAPADAEPEERVAVRVSARSLPETVNETVVIDNVTLYGVAIPPRVTTTTPAVDGIPGFAPIAAVAAIAAVALLRRRRA